MRDVNLVKENISRMIGLNAPESDIDQYVASEGYTPEMLQGGQQPQAPAQPQEQQPERSIPANIAMGIPQGLGNAAIGAFQAATDVGEKAASLIERIYYGNNTGAKTFGNRLADQVKQRNEQQAQLPTSEKVGIAVGQALPYLATGVGTGKAVAAATGSNIAGLAAGGLVGGAVSSALSPQEQAGLGNRAEEAGKGAAIGGLVGGGLGLGIKAVGGVGKVGKALFTVRKPEDILAARLPKEQTLELLEQLKTASPDNPVMLPDIAGDSIKGLTRSIAKIPTGRDIITDALENRSQGAITRVADHLSK
jgi:hypothetical protein